MVIDLIVPVGAMAVTALWPRSWAGAVVVAVAAVATVATGNGSLLPALTATAPTISFLLAALAAAGVAARAGLAVRLAGGIARISGGRPLMLYSLVCLVTALATAVVSLDGAVVFLVPVVLELSARFGAARRPLLLGVVAVANSFSLALPEGNPTNLLVLARTGDALGDYVLRALPAGAAAAVLCAAGVAMLDRDELVRGAPPGESAGSAPLTRGFAAVLRLGIQLSGLLILLVPLAARVHLPTGTGLAGALLVAGGAALASALANNLPAAAATAALGGPGAYAALAGLSVGALAVEHGSVATLLAGDLARSRAWDRRLVPVAAAGLAVAVFLLWLGGP